MALSLVTGPADEPVTLAQAKKQCEIVETEDAHDVFLDTLAIPAARERAEDATGRQMLTATWALRLDQFPACRWIEIPRPPLLTVVSVEYVDDAGATQTLPASVYTVDNPSGPRCARGRIVLNPGQSWPSTGDYANAVVVTFTAGYGTDGDSVPPRIRMAMLRDCAALFEQRETLTTDGRAAIEVPDGAAHVYRAFKSRPTQRR
jgi:uncharacterized phiE125 gp8 family phage protein